MVRLFRKSEYGVLSYTITWRSCTDYNIDFDPMKSIILVRIATLHMYMWSHVLPRLRTELKRTKSWARLRWSNAICTEYVCTIQYTCTYPLDSTPLASTNKIQSSLETPCGKRLPKLKILRTQNQIEGRVALSIQLLLPTRRLAGTLCIHAAPPIFHSCTATTLIIKFDTANTILW